MLRQITGFLLAGSLGYAADISWMPAADTAGKADLVEGVVLHAYNGGAASTVSGAGASATQQFVFDGVTFTDLDFVGTGADAGELPGSGSLANVYTGSISSTGDVDFDRVIQSLTWSRSGIVTGNLTLDGFTTGKVYRVQVFFNDQRSSSDRVMTFGDGNGHTVDVGASAVPGSQSTDYGQHAIGTFTATAPEQVISMAANGFGNVHVNALLVVGVDPPDPLVPANLGAVAGDERVLLDWDDNLQFGFSHFVVERSLVAGGAYLALTQPPASDFVDTGLTNGVPVFYRVRAVNTDAVESGASVVVSATPAVPPPPETPVNLTVTPGEEELFLDWDDNTQATFSHYIVRRSITPGSGHVAIATTSESMYTDPGLGAGTSYYYVVRAVNISGVESSDSNEAAGVPLVHVPSPNFVFIITDDQDADTLAVYNPDTACETPVLNQLAREGMLFHQAHHMGSWSGAVCRPSRTMIMTGRTVWRIPGRPSGGGPVPADMADHCLAQIFNDAGYDTMRTCKNGNSYADANARFSVVNDSTKRVGNNTGGSAWHADRVLDYLQTRVDTGDTDAFMIYFGFSHPHDPRRGKPALLAKYGAVQPGPPSVPAPASPLLPINYLPGHPFFHGHQNLRDEERVEGIGTNRTEAAVRNERGKYFACIENIDIQVGRVLQKLDDMGVTDNTYIIFASDHGMAVGRHGLQGKQNLYEHTWKVPFFVKGPGIAADAESDAMIYLADVLPTLCDLAGIPIRPSIDGISFRPVLEGAATSARDVVYGTYSGGTKPGMRSVKTGRWKLVKFDVDSNRVQETQLFDLEQNPYEFLAEHKDPATAVLLGLATSPNQVDLADHPAYALVRQALEEKMMEQRKVHEDPYQVLGDRTLLRFESDLLDRMPWGNHATAMNGAPVFTTDVFHDRDYVVGEVNDFAIDLEQAASSYLTLADSRELDFGTEPFTVEAWVKLETLPSGALPESTLPVVMKKVIPSVDADLDYLFLAGAGIYGGAAHYDKLAVHLGSGIVVSSLAIPDTNWHYISLAVDPASDVVRFTLDEQVDTQASTLNGTPNAGPLVVGAHLNSSGVVDYAFDGLLDELSITAGYLSLDELQPLSAVSGLPEAAIIDPSSLSFSRAGLTFHSRPDQLYELQETLSLAPPDWHAVQSYIGGFPGAGQTLIDFNPPGDRRGYYRIKATGPIRP
jgi:choline-sulfatase